MQPGKEPTASVPGKPLPINRQADALPSNKHTQIWPTLTLAWIFLRIGATAFGGLGASLALVERELVTKRRLVTEADVTEALTYTKLLPGSTGIQVMSYLGYKLGGWHGSAMATAAFILPSALLMLLLAAAYVAATALPATGPAVNGLTAAVVGVLLATTYRLGKSNNKEPLMWGIAIVAFSVGAFLRVSAALIVVAAGLLGILLFSAPAAKPQAKGGSR
jgi:chromate transporter